MHDERGLIAIGARRLVADKDFRARIRAMAERHAAQPIVDELVATFARVHGDEDGAAYRASLLDVIETFSDRRAERYWQLLAIMNGWPAAPSTIPAWEWFAATLRVGLDE